MNLAGCTPESALLTLAEIPLRGVELDEDRRMTRYVRLRKAIAEGIERPDALKRKQPESEAVEPALDEVARRLMRWRG